MWTGSGNTVMLVNLQVFDLLLSKQNRIKYCPTSGALVSSSVPTAGAWFASCHRRMGTKRQYTRDVLGEDERGPPSSRSLEEPWWVSDPVDPWYLYEQEPGGWVDIVGVTPSAPTANTFNISFKEITSTCHDTRELTFL